MSAPSLLQPGVNVHSTRRPQVYAAVIATYILAAIAISLRFWARKLLKTKLWLDDWIAAASLVRLQKTWDRGDVGADSLTSYSRQDCWHLGLFVSSAVHYILSCNAFAMLDHADADRNRAPSRLWTAL